MNFGSQKSPSELLPDYTTPGERIRACRQNKGLLIKTLAQKAGISIAGLSGIENGRINPDLQTIKKLAIIFEVPIPFLGCYDMLPETTLLEKLEKARLYHGHTKEEMAPEIGVVIKSIFAWQNGRQPGEKSREKLDKYFKILRD